VSGGKRKSAATRGTAQKEKTASGRRQRVGTRAYRKPKPAETRRGRIFLLSPANSSGNRGRMVMSERATFPLAARLRREGAPIGEVFSFLSGLYFRGKLAYALTFAAPPNPQSPLSGGVFVITPSAGLRTADTIITAEAMRAFAAVDVSLADPRYRVPLEQSARALAEEIGDACEVVLLGSIASPKYVDVLLKIFGDRLLFPIDFVGRGDMSRGGLMLRCAAAREELTYVPVAGAVRHGPRPAKLDPKTRPPYAGGHRKTQTDTDR
jgi:hypothetical protein